MAKIPIKYSDELGAVICQRMIMGESVAKICKDENMPRQDAIYRWAFNKEHPFAELYKRARELQAEKYVDEIMEIADSSEDDYKIVDGRKVIDHENIQRARLRVDTRKWVACKVLPKIYGDKSQVDLTTDGKPIESLTDEERLARMSAILEQARKRRAGQATESESDI
jgi:hypothetical protein